MRCVLLCMLEVVEGALCLLEVKRCTMPLSMLEVVGYLLVSYYAMPLYHLSQQELSISASGTYIIGDECHPINSPQLNSHEFKHNLPSGEPPRPVTNPFVLSSGSPHTYTAACPTIHLQSQG